MMIRTLDVGQRPHGLGRRRIVYLAAFLGFAFLISFLTEPSIAGQGAAPASIIGRVTDGTGAVLPGVTVTATSPALQVPEVIVVTNDAGEYRITPLPIGR